MASCSAGLAVCRSEVGDPATAEDRPVPLAGPDELDVACSLDHDAVGERAGAWSRILDSATSRTSIPGGIRVTFGRGVDVGELARLAASEQSCCSFFHFAIGIGSPAVTLDVTGPPEAQDVITAVFGAAA